MLGCGGEGSPHLHRLWGEGAAELRLCPFLSLFLPQASSGKGRCATNLSPLRMGLEERPSMRGSSPSPGDALEAPRPHPHPMAPSCPACHLLCFPAGELRSPPPLGPGPPAPAWVQTPARPACRFLRRSWQSGAAPWGQILPGDRGELEEGEVGAQEGSGLSKESIPRFSAPSSATTTGHSRCPFPTP